MIYHIGRHYLHDKIFYFKDTEYTVDDYKNSCKIWQECTRM